MSPSREAYRAIFSSTMEVSLLSMTYRENSFKCRKHVMYLMLCCDDFVMEMQKFYESLVKFHTLNMVRSCCSPTSMHNSTA